MRLPLVQRVRAFAASFFIVLAMLSGTPASAAAHHPGGRHVAADDYLFNTKPVIVKDGGGGRFEVFSHGTDGYIYHMIESSTSNGHSFGTFKRLPSMDARNAAMRTIPPGDPYYYLPVLLDGYSYELGGLRTAIFEKNTAGHLMGIYKEDGQNLEDPLWSPWRDFGPMPAEANFISTIEPTTWDYNSPIKQSRLFAADSWYGAKAWYTIPDLANPGPLTWKSLPSPAADGISVKRIQSVATNKDGRYQIFAINSGGANEVVSLSMARDHTFNGQHWRKMGITCAKSVNLARDADDRLEAFAVAGQCSGTGLNRLMNARQTSPDGEWARGWTSMPGSAPGGATSSMGIGMVVKAERNRDGRLEVFGTSAPAIPGTGGGDVVHWWQDTWGGAFGDGERLGGGDALSYPAVGQHASGQLRFFYLSKDGSLVTNIQKTPNGGWYPEPWHHYYHN